MKTKTLPNPLQLTRIIFDYWLSWMSLTDGDLEWVKDPVPQISQRYPFLEDREGLFWYDGHNATFWYMLNVAWYEMNDKLYARAGCKEPFDEWLRDFDSDYLKEYYS